jgi:hypothetical protein
MSVFITTYLIITDKAALIVSAYDEDEALELAKSDIDLTDNYSIEELPKAKQPGIVRVIRKT